MSIAPLFLKYRTPSGKCYIYDSGTSEIVCVEEILYHILDDYHVLNEQELIDKHRSLGEAKVVRLLASLNHLQSRDSLRSCSANSTETRTSFIPRRGAVVH